MISMKSVFHGIKKQAIIVGESIFLIEYKMMKRESKKPKQKDKNI